MSPDRPPSVVHVLWSGNTGGIERLVTDLAAEQVMEGLTVGVAFGRAEGPFVELAQDAGAEVTHLDLATGYDIRPRRAATRLLTSNDVVHLHGYNVAFESLCRRLARPVVFTEHGGFGKGRKLGLGHGVKQRLKARFLRKTVAVVVANSAYTAARLADLYGVPRDRVHLVHNGIPFSAHSRIENCSSARTGSLRVAFVGRLAGFKRVDRLIDAVARMPHPRHVAVTIAGDGPLEGELRAKATAAGVDEHVTFVGYRRDVASLLTSVDVLVQPSQGEPFGLAIVESCAAGVLPIVFADGGGALEVIPPDGIVVRDVDELASVLARLPGSPAISPPAREARAAWAREHFPISATHRKYLELYRRAAEIRSTNGLLP